MCESLHFSLILCFYTIYRAIQSHQKTKALLLLVTIQGLNLVNVEATSPADNHFSHTYISIYQSAGFTSENNTMGNTRSSSKSELVIPAKKPTTFFSLPIEIRTIIYKMHLPQTTSITLCSCLHAKRSDLGVNLLRTCRRIYLEASQYAYSSRLFKTSGSCILCCQNLTLMDSRFLNHLQKTALNRIENLELRFHVNCATSYRASVSSYRATRAPRTDVRLGVTATMQRLNYLCIKVVFTNFVCCSPSHAVKRVPYLGLEDLFIQVYRSIPARVEVRWKAEISGEGLSGQEARATTEAVTQTLRILAERCRVLEGRRASEVQA